MGQVMTWCFAAPVVFIFTILLILFCMAVIARTLPTTAYWSVQKLDERVLECPGCLEKIRFSVPSAPRIRCSCGNIMGPPDGDKATCPKCREVIHVSRRSEMLRVKCPCGNVLDAMST